MAMATAGSSNNSLISSSVAHQAATAKNGAALAKSTSMPFKFAASMQLCDLRVMGWRHAAGENEADR